jgi:hypothetical protein
MNTRAFTIADMSGLTSVLNIQAAGGQRQEQSQRPRLGHVAHVCVVLRSVPAVGQVRHRRPRSNTGQRCVHVGHPPGSRRRFACGVGVVPTARGLVRLAWHVTWFTLVFTILFFS